MGYRILKGNLAIEGKSPDGDTVAFYLDEGQIGDWVWTKKRGGGRFPRFNRKYQANVRFEAIDALELHFQVQNVWPTIKSHQNLELAIEARDKMLSLCGFDTSVLVENDSHRLSDPNNQLIPAVVAYKDIDPFGRLVGFIFHVDDAPPLSTEEKPERFLSADVILQSVNAKLLQEGLVFPTFYGGLYPELRNALTQTIKPARDEEKGVWENYRNEILLPRKPSISDVESPILLPKVYRRLVTHIASNGAMSNFASFLYGNGDTVVDTIDIRLSNLSAFVKSEATDASKTEYRLYLTRKPEELVFLPD